MTRQKLLIYIVENIGESKGLRGRVPAIGPTSLIFMQSWKHFCQITDWHAVSEILVLPLGELVQITRKLLFLLAN